MFSGNIKDWSQFTDLCHSHDTMVLSISYVHTLQYIHYITYISINVIHIYVGGVPVCIVDGSKLADSPLHWACSFGNDDVAAELLAWGCDPNLRNGDLQVRLSELSMRMYVCMYVCMYVLMCECVHKDEYLQVCVDVCICMYVCIRTEYVF